MATAIRPEISGRNRYWISKHRHYELRHFCRQYPEWKRAYTLLDESVIRSAVVSNLPSSNTPADPTGNVAVQKLSILKKIDMIENAAERADRELSYYILKGITEGMSYTQLKSKFNIPCGRDMYYDRYRRFFWLLDKERK